MSEDFSGVKKTSQNSGSTPQQKNKTKQKNPDLIKISGAISEKETICWKRQIFRSG